MAKEKDGKWMDLPKEATEQPPRSKGTSVSVKNMPTGMSHEKMNDKFSKGLVGCK